MMLKAVFFDMGGTIDTFRYSRQHRITEAACIRECLGRTGIMLACNDTELADLITRGASDYLQWNLVSNIELSPAEIWSTYFHKGLGISTAKLEPAAEELAFLYETRLFIREMRPEVPAVLAAVKAMGLKIGCISNTQSTRQVPENLKEYGIADYFDPVVLSSEYGRRKPDPAIFYYAARLAEVPTSSCIYIGDKISRDILGAQRAGFRTAIQIRHPFDNGDPDEGASPDFIIQEMTELLPIIEELQNQDRQSPGLEMHRKVKAVFFDAGDILYYRPHRDMHLKAFLKGKTLHPHPGFEQKKNHLRELAYSGKLRRHSYYEQVLRLHGFTDPDEIAEGINAMRQDDYNVEIIDGAAETVRQLKERGFLLGIITDTALSFSRKLDWFEEHGFGRVWDTVISSKEIGARKPCPEMYRLAITQAGVKPCETIFVGHKRSEIDGAKAVGMKTIALNFDEGTQADVFIKDIRDLLQVPDLQS
jgi:putative hydrolase of the HAD superfamily